ncbi:MAG: redoxin domain-containing protein, partial [Chitinophagaceae bacterium]
MNYHKKVIYLKLLLLAYSINCYSQTIYKTGQAVANFKASKILNYTTATSTLDSLGGQLTVLDFFGTWCVPCIKALPNLSQLQQKFNGKLSIILISTEEPGRLEKFIAARKGFSFPVIADADGSITGLFEPPSFPYTLLLNKEKKIVGIIEASLITENEITKWLSGDNSIPEVRKTESEKNPPLPITMNTVIRSKNELVALSQNFLYAVKTGEETQLLEEKIRLLPYDDLVKRLATEDEKKAFWINIYNGFVQVLLKHNKEAYKSRSLFFSGKQIELANKKFSLDDIEH